MRPFDASEALLRALSAPRRNHFFYGKRMDVQHFVMEQSYGKLKQWLLNRLTLGKGVICGLRVSVDGDRICVDPGVAIDGLGREIIVPVRSCIDPLAVDDCCGQHARAPQSGPNGEPQRPTSGVYTLWLCYHECLADQQAVLVSGCDTRDHCAAGTVVETFCLKAMPGLPSLQGDPDWCALLWGKDAPHDHGDGNNGEPGNHTGSGNDAGMNNNGNADSGNSGSAGPSFTERLAKVLAEQPPGTPGNTPSPTTYDRAQLDAAAASHRHLLCELLDKCCDPPEGDACVPLAVILLRDGKFEVESCLVRPRIYSNATLLDLILCLASKIEECCGKHPQPPAELMRVAAIDFLNRNSQTGAGTVITSLQTPFQDALVNINAKPNAIRIRFSKPFATDQHAPSAADVGDPDYRVYNIQIVPDDPIEATYYVPGRITTESADTVRFDLSRSPYMRRTGEWLKGRYRIFLRGTEQLTTNWQALADTSGRALDGEPIAPAAGVMSGDGTKGGDFIAHFVIGASETRETLRVTKIDFVSLEGEGSEVVASVRSPLDRLTITKPFTSVRVRFNRRLDQEGEHRPTTASRNEASWELHNVIIMAERATGVTTPYLPGTITFEAGEQIRFDCSPLRERGRAIPRFPNGLYRLVLRGEDNLANRQPALGEPDGTPLDGEPITPSGVMISGDGQPGGDFELRFTVRIG